MSEKYIQFRNQKDAINKKSCNTDNQSDMKNIDINHDREFFINKTAQNFMKNMNNNRYKKDFCKPNNINYIENDVMFERLGYSEFSSHSTDSADKARLLGNYKNNINSKAVINDVQGTPNKWDTNNPIKQRSFSDLNDTKRRYGYNLNDKDAVKSKLANDNGQYENLSNGYLNIDDSDLQIENNHFLSRESNMKKYKSENYQNRTRSLMGSDVYETKNYIYNKPNVYVHKNEYDLKEREHAYMQMKRHGENGEKRPYMRNMSNNREFNDENRRRMVYIEKEKTNDERTVLEAAEGLLLLSKSFKNKF